MMIHVLSVFQVTAKILQKKKLVLYKASQAWRRYQHKHHSAIIVIFLYAVSIRCLYSVYLQQVLTVNTILVLWVFWKSGTLVIWGL